jgi:hypothetical protein
LQMNGLEGTYDGLPGFDEVFGRRRRGWNLTLGKPQPQRTYR